MNLRRRLVAIAALALAATVVAPAATASAATSHQLLKVGVGHHSTFDRVVFTFSGKAAPTHTISYVSQVVADPSGKTVSLLGNFKLRLVFQGVAASNVGLPAFQGDIRPGFPQLREVKGAGDFEGVVSFGIGVTSRTTFKVTKLTGPARLVLDLPIASTSTLPRTGAPDTGSLVGWGFALLVTGGLTMVAARRRLPVPAA